VRTPSDLRRLLGRHRPGGTVRLSVRRNGGVRQFEVRTAATVERGRRRAIIGVFVEQAADIKLPVNVRIDAGNIGGPSAGLAFALDILEKLGRDVDHGYRVAATGSIDLDGSVGAIGGVEQKTIAVRRGKIDVFLVPAGENAAEARRFAHGLRVIPVQTFQQALRALATLPRKTKD
jgi:Lon-like protease